MKAFVFSDPALAPRAGQFVWLELNTDLTANGPAVERFRADALPTFLVVDPKDEAVVLRWVGSFTLPQADTFLEEAREKARGVVPPSPAEQALARADRLYGVQDYKAAARAYREALAAAPVSWPRYHRAVEALVFCYQTSGAFPEAVGLAREALPRLEGTPSALVVGVAGLDSAVELAGDQSQRKEAIAALEAGLRRALADPRIHAAADDRSGAYLSLLEARKRAGDTGGARRVATEWAAFLEAQAAQAKDPDQRAVFDSHRLSAYLELGQPAKAIPMLEASARALPGDYNPPNRLARAYAATKQWDRALAASSRAVALASGRARLRVLTARAALLQEKGDPAAARQCYDEAIAFAESLPEAERPTKQIEQLRKQRDKLAAAKS
jgi:tetratricopeptide (TPR) repeat protein